MKRLSLIGMGLAFLSACGDGSQATEKKEVSSSPSDRPSIGQDFLTEQNGRQAPDFIPLASDFLRENLTLRDPVAALEDIRMARSSGDLSDQIVRQAEALGLVSNAELNSFENDSFALADGLQWHNVARPQPSFLVEENEGPSRNPISEMQLSLDGVQVHNARIKSIVENGNTTWLSGSKPQWLDSQQRPQSTPFALSIGEVRSLLARELGFPEWRFHSPQRTYIAEKHMARAAYLFTVSAEHSANDRAPAFPLEVAVDADVGKILWQRPLTMHAVGKAQMYIENKATSTVLSEVSLPDLQNDTTLNHSLFNVYNCNKNPRYLETGDGSICSPVTGSSGAFNFSYSSNAYDATVAYAAITRAMEKFRSLDDKSLRTDWDQERWPGTRGNFGLQEAGSKNGAEKRMNIYVSTETQSATTNKCGRETTPDNAQYLWAGQTGNGNPEILIGYGGYGINNCGSLRELGKDMDVTMHEFGHHIVFRGLSNSKNQSVALHEGYSDYLTYAVTGNNLLAENSYPTKVALRTGILPANITFNKFKPRSGGGYLSVTDYMNYPHQVGEFWSGILWEMRASLGKNAAGIYKMDKIVWDSIDLIKSDGGIYDGVAAISESARRYAERFGEDSAAIQSAVQKIFVKYEFARFSSSGEFMPTDALGGGSINTSSEAPVSTSKKKGWGCGELAALGQKHSSSEHKTSTYLLMTLLFGLPGGLALMGRVRNRARVQVPVVNRKKQRKN